VGYAPTVVSKSPWHLPDFVVVVSLSFLFFSVSDVTNRPSGDRVI
jgi:hypothetical protein